MGKGKKKINPKRVPISLGDAKKTAQKATDDAIHLSMALFLMVLKDDFGFDNSEITIAWNRLDKLSEEVAEGRLKIDDFIDTLRSEYNIDLQR